MRHSTHKHFADPAAFVARQIRQHGRRNLLFTCARHGEGTTTTVLGIARALHLAYSIRILTVEINPRSHGFQAVLGLDSPPAVFASDGGLEAGDLAPSAAGFSMLSLVTNGPNQHADGNLPAVLANLMKRTDGQFDTILLDVPPVLEYPQALAIAPEMDGVVLVVESGRTRQEMLEHLRAEFLRENIKLLGSILAKQEYAIPDWLYHLLFR